MRHDGLIQHENPADGPIRPCPDCGGSGKIPSAGHTPCGTCCGTGKVMLVPVGRQIENMSIDWSEVWEHTGGKDQPGACDKPV